MSELFAAGPSSSDSTRVTLTPSPGFTIKSVTTEPGFYSYAPTQTPGSSTSHRSSKNLLEPAEIPKTLQIAKGVKVFLNIAWDKNIPPPPPTDEEAIRRAILADDVDDSIGDGAYFVPAIVSEPREDRDKAGKPSIVFDCIFNSSLKSRCTKDNEFRMYLIALALEHAEQKAHIGLSREIGTPNIASKGKLEPREVLIPNSLLRKLNIDGSSTNSIIKEADIIKAKGSPTPTSETKPKSILKGKAAKADASEKEKKRPLIEEISSSPTPVKVETQLDDEVILRLAKNLPPPRWKWKEEGDNLVVEIETPTLTRDLHTNSILDIESRRVLLYVPDAYFLDVNLNLTEAQIGKIETLDPAQQEGSDMPARNIETLRIRGENAGEALRLKKVRPFRVESAKATWLLGEGKIVILL